jgi:hypothetical protein
MLVAAPDGAYRQASADAGCDGRVLLAADSGDIGPEALAGLRTVTLVFHGAPGGAAFTGEGAPEASEEAKLVLFLDAGGGIRAAALAIGASAALAADCPAAGAERPAGI